MNHEQEQGTWEREQSRDSGKEWSVKKEERNGRYRALSRNSSSFLFRRFFLAFFFQCFARCIFNRLAPWWRYCPEYIDDVLLWHQGHLRLFEDIYTLSGPHMARSKIRSVSKCWYLHTNFRIHLHCLHTLTSFEFE